MKRRSKVFNYFVADFLCNRQYYFEYPRTVAEVARRLGVSNQALKSFLLGNPIPYVSTELCLREHRGRFLPAYRIFVHDWERACNFIVEMPHG